MKKIKVLSVLAIASSLLFVYSCKKKTNDVDSEMQSVVDNSICEQEFMQIQPTTNNLAIKTKGTSAQKLAGIAGGCDSLTYLSGDTTMATGFTSTNPPTFEYDYGTCSLANTDNKIRTGKLWIRFIGRPKLAGSKTIIKLLNYKVNGSITYSCDSIVVTSGSNATAPTKDFTVAIINGVCTGTSGWTVKYSATKFISVNTNSTQVLNDDVITVSGNSSGTNRNGKNFTVVLSNIEKKTNCEWVSKGKVDVTPEGLSTRTVDYGNGNCDNDATFTVNGQTIAFKLK